MSSLSDGMMAGASIPARWGDVVTKWKSQTELLWSKVFYVTPANSEENFFFLLACQNISFQYNLVRNLRQTSSLRIFKKKEDWCLLTWIMKISSPAILLAMRTNSIMSKYLIEFFFFSLSAVLLGDWLGWHLSMLIFCSICSPWDVGCKFKTDLSIPK